jgi:hypothetical protein
MSNGCRWTGIHASKCTITPTSQPWLTIIERFFVDLTGYVIRAGSFT